MAKQKVSEPADTLEQQHTAAGPKKGRSGGVVDAPGKKHRKPTPNVTVPRSRSTVADVGRIARMKGMNANRRRGGR